MLLKIVAFFKFQGWVRVVVSRWSGRFGWAPAFVLVIFKVALEAIVGIGVSTLDPQDPLQG